MIGSLSSGNSMKIGGGVWEQRYSFIDDLWIFQRVLSNQEITNLYTTGAP